jgi:protein-S-isoprenylcysteine O-methyltransferase Ste14
LRALLAFLALPGLVAFAAPPLLIWPEPLHATFRTSGLAVLALGTVLLLWCVRDFYVAGSGTLAPWDPPRHLVVFGLYRFSRNPMYVAVFLVLLGWAIGFRSPLLSAYALAVLVAFHLRVVFGEEPWLAKTHGEAWTQYVSEVPRWFGVPRRAPSRDRALG